MDFDFSFLYPGIALIRGGRSFAFSGEANLELDLERGRLSAALGIFFHFLSPVRSSTMFDR